ncbi:MAG TPA: helicase-exonuclease AddAB subunit AddA [Methylomusa anaerophila]|uniref:ATP-dependent helicase/nuclease subunit A n=1 Tax=Methylomusa anaerophila TaxID=1930071 RepID=A0A348AHC1_9FIRM|nr:helicase-exonuclease AddAB subunit AddA [Methylomusa anaerophila]BBB90469.1 ATP-dependent helicase/nuclease subunit A [Methylomusa anaerophila]HML89889.1 helicase-exonuclease AddAB subunit AddA [Methylomusa anaerophila]
MMQCSPQQLAAIEARRQNLLVAAAAGSGKTWVLVERIIRRVIDPAEMLSVDRLLVVTFTNAAAAEMRTRIAEALLNVLDNMDLAAKDRRRHVERQLALLNSASISTLHSFCQSIVRQYFYHINVDPNFRVASETETDLIKTDVLEALLEEGYTEAEADFMLLVDQYGDEDGDSSLSGLVLKLYDFSRSHPWPEDWLDGLAKAFALPAGTDFDATVWSALVRDKIILDLELSRQELAGMVAEAALPGNPAAYGTTFAEDIEVLDSLLAAARRSWTDLAAALTDCRFSRIANVGREVAAEVKQEFQDRRNKVKNRVKKMSGDYFQRSPGELVADLQAAAPQVAALVKLVKAFGQGFAAAKQAKGLADFNDLEHLCLAVLRDSSALPGETKPSAVARELQARFSEIMVDEYQDTNRVQEEILQLLSSPAQPNLFMVGDVKQSIYRFRLAEPELFMHKYSTFGRDGLGTNRRIDLSQNFRSRDGVLHAVNFLFSQLMTRQTAELDYGEAEQLNPGGMFPATDLPTLAGPVELYLIAAAEASHDDGGDTAEGESDPEEDEENSAAGESFAAGSEADNGEELSTFEQEALLIANKINGLMDAGYTVYDKETKSYRPLTYRDMVILLRSVQGKAQVLLDALRREGIPSYAELDAGYFQETEVTVILSLLSVIDNPRQDIPLAAVLRSPLVGLTAAEMGALRLACPAGDLWEALNTGRDGSIAAAKVAGALDQLNKWRSLARRQGVAELVWQIYRDTGYYDYVGGMPGGVLRQANLRALYDRAEQYEATNFRGLFRFLRFIDRLKERGSDLSVARALSENEDVVRVMSIHKSKGLEFPLVFAADLGKNFNLQDTRALVLCHKELGVGPYVTVPEYRFRYPTPARWGIQHKIELETKAEEQRILYVALTRAREKLILVGTVKKPAATLKNWCREVGAAAEKLPAARIIKAKNYLDWIGPAVARHRDGRVLRLQAECQDEPAGPLAAHPSEWTVNIFTGGRLTQPMDCRESMDEILQSVRQLAPVARGSGTAWVEAVLGWEYPWSQAVGKPAKLSVSEIKRRLEIIERSDAEPAPSLVTEKQPLVRPRFTQNVSGMTAVEYGIVLHTLMQHVDLTGDLTAGGIAAQAKTLTAREILLPGQGEELDYKAVAAFFANPLGQRLRASGKVWRELSFSLMLPADRFYPDLAGSKEQVFVQGVIDCLFTEADGVVLLDYKTDRTGDARELVAKYAAQLSMYAVAVERILGLKVKEQYLYAFGMGEAIKLDAWG